MKYTFKWRVLREVGRLCGNPDPEGFADLMLAPPCQHTDSWYFDMDEVCPEPCQQRHWWCSVCDRPMEPECPIVTEEL